MKNLPKHTQRSKSNHSISVTSGSTRTIIEVLEFCKAQNLPARVVGKWVWVKFDSKPNAEIRQSLKDFGFGKCVVRFDSFECLQQNFSQRACLEPLLCSCLNCRYLETLTISTIAERIAEGSSDQTEMILAKFVVLTSRPALNQSMIAQAM
jgi:hypothetical protein